MTSMTTHLDFDFTYKPHLAEFVDYCQDFYDKDRTGSIYPFASEAEIQIAVLAHVTDLNPMLPFDGDTADREAVRDRILTMRELINGPELKYGPTNFVDAVNAGLTERGETNLIQRIESI
jgi:hypothetical protein